ncbi:MAG: glycerate dehydrogenase [Burkholderiales bacterium]|nr:glycerate dehydrogenase [Burkholderiales bacterium]
MQIVILDNDTRGSGLDFSAFSKLAPTIIHGDLMQANEILAAVADASVIVANKAVLDAKLIQQLPDSVRLIAVSATGYDNIDINAAAARNIRVVNAPGYGTNAVAQMTLALILNCATQLTTQVSLLRDVGWSKEESLSIPMSELAGKTLGIVGLGAIGSRVAELALAFGMQVIAYTRTAKDLDDVEEVNLAELAARSDYVSLHCALSHENSRLINREFLAKMKSSAFIINTARGGLIDESALVDALQRKIIAGAALDVLTNEPPAKDHPLLTMPNVIVTPHIAWGPLESRQRCLDITESNIASFIYGEAQNLLN